MHEDIVDALAAYRLTRFVQLDTYPPMARTRDFLRSTLPSWGIELLDCPWCLGFWVSVLVVYARRRYPRLWPVVARAWAASAAVGIVSTMTNLGQKYLEV